MAPASSTSRVSSNTLIWRPTKIMHMRDLSKDDDFLSHLLVEKLGTGTVPLLVHKMDSSRKLPKTNTADLMRIVRRVSCLLTCNLFFQCVLIYAPLLPFSCSLSPARAPSSKLSVKLSMSFSCTCPLACYLARIELTPRLTPYRLPPIRYYLKSYTQKQINAFST